MRRDQPEREAPQLAAMKHLDRQYTVAAPQRCSGSRGRLTSVARFVLQSTHDTRACRPAGTGLHADRRRGARARVLRADARPWRPPSARRLRHQRPPGHAARRQLHRGAHPGHHAGDLRLPAPARASTGPLYMGKDTHALSAPAQRTALEVLAGNGVETIIQRDGGFTPTPVISRAILACNHGRRDRLADGIVVTPSHNPPEDGGFKYNPPHGGPADTDVTRWIQDRANELLRGGNAGVRRMALDRGAERGDDPPGRSRRGPTWTISATSIDMDGDPRCRGDDRGRSARRRVAARTGRPIVERYGLDITIVNSAIDPTFGFMTLDHDGQIRMDCSSPYAMAGLVGAQGSVRGRVRQRSRCGPPRHRDAVGRADEPEPLPRRRDPTTSWPTGRRGRRRRRSARRVVSSGIIDRVVAGARPAAAGSPGGLQVVRAGAVRRLACASAAKKAPAQASCDATARSGRPTRTA